MSLRLLVSPGTRLLALEAKATKRPSALMEGSLLEFFPWSPVEDTLTMVVSPVTRSWTNMSVPLLMCSGHEIGAGGWEGHIPAVGADGIMARVPGVALGACGRYAHHDGLPGDPVRGRTRRLRCRWRPPPPGWWRREPKATKRPLALTEGEGLSWFPWSLVEETLTLLVVPVRRSWMKMSPVAVVSSGTRLVAFVLKATKRPSALMEGE